MTTAKIGAYARKAECGRAPARIGMQKPSKK